MLGAPAGVGDFAPDFEPDQFQSASRAAPWSSGSNIYPVSEVGQDLQQDLA
jgi:hypothetical protein